MGVTGRTHTRRAVVDCATARCIVRPQMRRASVVLGCSLISPIAVANGSGAPTPSAGDGGAGVIGGSNAEVGKWPDVVAILAPSSAGDDVRCTGTLVAPTVVLTASHCYDATDPPLPDRVLIGTSSLARPAEGETIEISRGERFPDAANTMDLAVLVLARASTRTPRAIASGWARVDIANGAAVSLVGFGAVDMHGERYVDALQEATSTITDFDCSRSPGCRARARPAGELGAGGRGVDTCPGDSGGPLYLTTDQGTWLAGVTSRSYDGARFACSEGGIYARPEKVVDWIEAAAGVKVARGPEPQADPIIAMRGESGTTAIIVNDPRSSSHRFHITSSPARGAARVREDGAVRVCVDPEAEPGDDALTVTITDTTHARRALPITIKIQIGDGNPPAMPCDLGDFGGCCDSGRSGGAIPLAIGVLALLRRRRRCAGPRESRTGGRGPFAV